MEVNAGQYYSHMKMRIEATEICFYTKRYWKYRVRNIWLISKFLFGKWEGKYTYVQKVAVEFYNHRI